VTGDGYPELWLIDYDSGQDCAGSGDYNDKLLRNNGSVQPGFFADMTDPLLESFADSAFGASGEVIDMNGDNLKDLVMQFAGFVGIAYNANTNPFQVTDSPIGASTYFVSAGDLNQDNKTDLVTSDDGSDRYLLNQGNGPNGAADFVSFTYEFTHNGSTTQAADDDGFGGDNMVADLDMDGWNDVLITDVDVDISGCGRRMHIYRNLGGTPGGDVVLEEQTTGSSCQNIFGNPPSCLVASIPANKLEGVHDVAVFDINGDTWNDMVVGRCGGTEVYINQPPGPPAGGTPDGDTIPGSQLVIDKPGIGLGNEITLSWGPSCTSTDTNYEIYEGAIGDFTGHQPVVCSTDGAMTATINTEPGDRFYLIVPTNDVFEGSYGRMSSGGERPAGAHQCHPQNVGSCD
jgi:hypothetical protein